MGKAAEKISSLSKKGIILNIGNDLQIKYDFNQFAGAETKGDLYDAAIFKRQLMAYSEAQTIYGDERQNPGC